MNLLLFLLLLVWLYIDSSLKPNWLKNNVVAGSKLLENIIRFREARWLDTLLLMLTLRLLNTTARITKLFVYLRRFAVVFTIRYKEGIRAYGDII